MTKENNQHNLPFNALIVFTAWQLDE